jgi:hypothetical protein
MAGLCGIDVGGRCDHTARALGTARRRLSRSSCISLMPESASRREPEALLDPLGRHLRQVLLDDVADVLAVDRQRDRLGDPPRLRRAQGPLRDRPT